MRTRSALLASLVAVAGVAAAPALADAAPHHNHGLTIVSSEDPSITGDSLDITGQLTGASAVGQKIVLYHRINPNAVFTVIGSTTTTSGGQYTFTRADGVVITNRSWFVRAPGLPGSIHSKTIHEKVSASISTPTVSTLSGAATTTGNTNHPLVFAGTIAPAGFHNGERVYLQEQDGLAGDTWTTLKSGRITASSYSIKYRFIHPGVHDVRVLFRGDDRNIVSASDTTTVVIQQTENPRFTINTSAAIIPNGTSTAITGTLYMPGSTTVVDPGVSVTLFSHIYGQPYIAGPSVPTGTDGSYSFTVTPAHNTVYEVQVAASPSRHTAQLFEGVSDVVTINESSPTSTVGGSVTFSGTVTPSKVGHVIYLQRLDKEGNWSTVAISTITAGSDYSFPWTFGFAGAHTFRVRVPGGPDNAGGHSPSEVVTVS